MTPRTLFVWIVLAVSIPALAQVVAAEDERPDVPVDWSARAIQAWSDTCQKCHAVPDVAYETDRAFLGQIPETT